MWTYNYTDELYHFGVKGMKWGVRRNIKTNNANLDKKNTHSKAKKIAKSVGIMAIGVGISLGGAKFATSPKVRGFVARALDRFGSKKVENIANAASNLSGIYSKTLGRELTIEEVVAKGFDFF